MKNPLKMFSRDKTEPSQAVAVIPQNKPVAHIVADRYHVDRNEVLNTLALTAFKPRKNSDPFVTVEQMTALLVVANEYKLNPFTKEIYAFPQNGGIVPIVSIDGWMRIINTHPQFDGMKFAANDDESGKLVSMTCQIFRKDRKYPIEVTEYLAECKKDTEPWRKWPARMLRHKAAAQCARYAFGFSGIYEPDEADRIMESDTNYTSEPPAAEEAAPESFPDYPGEKFDKMFPGFDKAIKSGTKSAAAIISTIQTKYTLSPAQIKQIKDCEAIEGEVIQSEPEFAKCTACGNSLNNDSACDNCGASQAEN